MTKVIAITLPKGGVGKTTTAINLAASLAVLEKKTLLIDTDVSNNCATALGFDIEKLKGGIVDLVMNTVAQSKLINHTNLDYLDFIATDNAYDSEEKIRSIIHNRHRLKDIIRANLHEYEYIIIDTPPAMDGIIDLVLSAVDSVLIPVKTSYYSLMALKKLYKKIEAIQKTTNKHLKTEGITFTMFEANTKASKLTEKHTYPDYGKYVLKSTIPKTTVISEASYYGLPVVLFKARSIGAEAYLELAREIVIRNKNCPVKDLVKVSSLVKIQNDVPHDFKLYSNSPNPFRSSTQIKFDLPKSTLVKLSIYNIYMEKVEVLIDKPLDAGEYQITWLPGPISNGVYYYKFDAGSVFKMNKMILSR